MIVVVLTSFNRPKFLRRAIASLQAQTMTGWRCILIDLCSDWPEVAEVLNSIQSDWRFDVRCLAAPPESEAEFANPILEELNTGDADLVAWMCDNCEYDPQAFAVTRQWFDEQSPYVWSGYLPHQRDVWDKHGIACLGSAADFGHWNVTPPQPVVFGISPHKSALGYLDHSQVIHRLPCNTRWPTAAEIGRREVDGGYFDRLIAAYGPISPISPRILSFEHLAER